MPRSRVQHLARARARTFQDAWIRMLCSGADHKVLNWWRCSLSIILWTESQTLRQGNHAHTPMCRTTSVPSGTHIVVCLLICLSHLGVLRFAFWCPLVLEAWLTCLISYTRSAGGLRLQREN